MNWAVIENAGHVGERVVVEGFEHWMEANRRAREMYGEDEIAALHVDIAHWDEEGGFWSYDH